MIIVATDARAIVKCFEVGDGNISSIFDKLEWWASTICHKLHNDPDFSNREINIVGISQGGLLARAVIERCPDLQVHTLFTFGAPHTGVSPPSYLMPMLRPVFK